MRVRIKGMSDAGLRMLVDDHGADVQYIPAPGMSGIRTRSGGGFHGVAMEAMAVLNASWPTIERVVDDLSKIAGVVGTGISYAAFKIASRPSESAISPGRIEMIVENSASMTARQKSDATARAARNGMSIRFK